MYSLKLLLQSGTHVAVLAIPKRQLIFPPQPKLISRLVDWLTITSCMVRYFNDKSLFSVSAPVFICTHALLQLLCLYTYATCHMHSCSTSTLVHMHSHALLQLLCLYTVADPGGVPRVPRNPPFRPACSDFRIAKLKHFVAGVGGQHCHASKIGARPTIVSILTTLLLLL